MRKLKLNTGRHSHCGTVEMIPAVSMGMQVRLLASLYGSGIWHCCELRCRLQMLLRSGSSVAVAVARSCSSDLTPNLGICRWFIPKKQKQKNKTLTHKMEWSFFRCRLDCIIAKGIGHKLLSRGSFVDASIFTKRLCYKPIFSNIFWK